MSQKGRIVVANADFGEGWYDYDVVQAEDYADLASRTSAVIAYIRSLKVGEDISERASIRIAELMEPQ